jgi:signal peptidase II
MMRSNHMALGALVGAIVLAADQFSKWWVINKLDLPDVGQIVLLPVLNLTMVRNRGVTFGLLNGLGPWSSVILAVVALCVVGVLGLWLHRSESRISAVAIGAIAGGAIGNVIDRLRLGAVIDFIHAHIATQWGDYSWYVFNVADSAIVCGVVVLIIESLFSHRQQHHSA